GPAVERLFQALRFTQRRLERSALRQPQVHEQLWSFRVGEELLRHAREGRHRDGKEHGSDAKHGPATLDTPRDTSRKALVEASVVNIVLVMVPATFVALALGQHVIAQ